MHRVLRHLTLFWPLPNDCLLQLTGPQLSQGTAPSLGSQLWRPCRVAGKRAAPTPTELDEPAGDAAGTWGCSLGHMGLQPRTHGAAASASRAKQPRLSSWRRRKAKRAVTETGFAPSDPAPGAPAAARRKRAHTASPRSEAAPSASASSMAAKQLVRDIHATSRDAPQGERHRRGRRRGPRPSGFAKRPVALVSLAQLLRRHRRCSYHALLRAHVPASLVLHPPPSPPSPPSPPLPRPGGVGAWAAQLQFEQLLAHSVPHHVLVGFARAACRRVVPHGLVGGKHNWAAFSCHLSLLLREPHALAGEALTAQLVHGMRTSECAWLWLRCTPRRASRPPPGALREQRRLLGLLLRFLYQRIVLPLAGRLFVRGTTQGGGAALHYWPRGVWLRLRRLALRRTKAVALRLLPAAAAREVLRSAGRALGVSGGRVLPKASGGFRLIQMLNRAVQATACGRGGNSVNEALRPLFHLLRALADNQPAALGASVLGLCEVHARWRLFVASWRALAPCAPLHFCSSDIAQCYDTIDQVRLLDTVRAALHAHGASVQRRYSLLLPSQERLAVRGACVSQQGLGVSSFQSIADRM